MKRDNEKRNGHDVSDGKHQSFMRKDCDQYIVDPKLSEDLNYAKTKEISL